MLDVALGRQDQRLGRRARREAGQVLGRERVQPAQPVGSGDRDDAAVREVDDGQALLEQPLLAHRVAVVQRDPGVEALARDGARPGSSGLRVAGQGGQLHVAHARWNAARHDGSFDALQRRGRRGSGAPGRRRPCP